MLFALLLGTDPAPTTTTDQPGWFGLLPFLMLLPLFYLIFMRPARVQERQREAMISNLKTNDRVLTIGGIYGVVASVSDKDDFFILKTEDNVRLKMTKSSVSRNLTQEEAAKDKAKAKA